MSILRTLVIISVFFSCFSCNSIVDKTNETAEKKGIFPKLTSQEEISLISSAYLNNKVNEIRFQDYLKRNGFTIATVHKLTTDVGDEFYGFELMKTKTETGDLNYYYHAIYPKENGKDQHILIVQENSDKFTRLNLLYPFDNRQFFTKDISFDSPNINSRELTCDEAYDDFGDCIDCAIAELQDDTLSNVTCILAAWGPCVAAAIIHCL